MAAFFHWLAANPYILLFFTVGLSVWLGRQTIAGYGLGMVASAIVMAVVGIGAIWIGGWVFAVLVVALIGAMIWELAKITAAGQPAQALALGGLAVLSLGGLKVNEDSGAVIDGAGRDIPGLYAAGRTAIGIASSRYVSGLSLADCVFSGRRAGKAAALEDNRAAEPSAVASEQESVSV